MERGRRGVDMVSYHLPRFRMKTPVPSATDQLQSLIAANGPVINVCGRSLTVDGISGTGDRQLGTFRSDRAAYTGVRCARASVPSRPGAEVWAVVSGARTVCTFAVHAGRLIALGR